MEIIVEGWRIGDEDRREVAGLSPAFLSPLTEGQKAAAKRMGISEEDYARSNEAGKRGQNRLIEKAKRFATILERKLGSIAPGAHIGTVRLVTLRGEYRVDIYVDGNKKILFRVSEDMVDDFMEKGFAEVGRKIEQNLETVLEAQAGIKHGQA